jgi:hypothetical protein
VAVDDLPRFANASCVRRVAWAERRDHIQADWARVQPAVAAALALMAAGRHGGSGSAGRNEATIPTRW